MEIKCQRLREVLKLLEPAAPKRAAMPALTGVLVSPGRMRATDLEVSVTVDVPEAQGEPFVFPLRPVARILAGVPGAAVVRIEPRPEQQVAIEAPGLGASVEGFPAEDFPPAPRLKDPARAMIDGDALVRGLGAVTGYAAGSDRPVLSGVCLELGQGVTAVAADGYRLGWRELPIALPRDGLKEPRVIVPRRAVELLRTLWPQARRPDIPTGAGIAQVARARRMLAVAYDGKFIEFRFGDVCVASTLIEGSYPDWRALVPTAFTATVAFDAGDLHRAVRQLAGVSRETRIIRLLWSAARLTVQVRHENDDAKADVRCSADTEGRIAFDGRFLLGYLDGKDGPVAMCVTSPQGPVLFKRRGAGELVQMPMTVQWEGEPAQTEKPDGAEGEPTTPSTSESQPPDAGAGDDPKSQTTSVPKAHRRKRPVGQRSKRRSGRESSSR